MLPMYLIRAAGGLLYLAGAAVLVYNVWMTIAGKQRDEKPMTETPHDPEADKPLVQATSCGASRIREIERCQICSKA